MYDGKFCETQVNKTKQNKTMKLNILLNLSHTGRTVRVQITYHTQL